MRRPLWAAFAVVIGVLAWFLFAQKKGDPGQVELAAHSRESPSLATEAPAALDDVPAATAESSVLPAPAATSARKPEPRPAFSGVLVDAQGLPVAGASVSWTPLPSAPGGSREAVIDHVRATSRNALSDESGRFHFESAPAQGDFGSVVWASHARFEALSIPLSADSTRWVLDATHTLRTAAPASARVSAGPRPVEGALVLQTNAVGSPVEQLFLRSSVTDAAGVAELHPTAWEQTVDARKDRERSAPFTGFAAGIVALELAPTFAISGRIVRDARVPAQHPLSIVITAAVGSQRVSVERLSNVLDAWGPVELPLLPAQEYELRLEGLGVIPALAHARPRAADEHVAVVHTAREGSALWFFAFDEADTPLPEAFVVASWSEDGRAVETRTHAREDGYIPVLGCPPGFVGIQVSCPGYVSFNHAPFEVPEREPETHPIVLQRAQKLRGRCVQSGEPVPVFELFVWPVDAAGQRTTHRVADPEGRFELDVPLGTVALLGAAQGRGISAVQRVQVTAEELAEVTVELGPPLAVRGRVIDALTKEPIAEPSIEIVLLDGERFVGRFGSPFSGDERGEFRITGLALGRSSLAVSAPGYSVEQFEFTTRPGAELDLGAIALVERAPLVVRLASDGALDPTDCRVTADAHLPAPMIPLTPFDSRGELHVAAASAGWHAFRVDLPDGSMLHADEVLAPGEPWVVEFDLTHAGRVEVEVEGGELPMGTEAVLEQRSGGTQTRVAFLDEHARATFERLPAARMRLRVVESALTGKVLASEEFELGPGEVLSKRIRLGAGERSVRVVDGRGEPIPGTTVHVEGVRNRYATDEHGRCRVAGLTEETAIFHLEHPLHGYRLGVRADVPAAEREIELVLEGAFDVSIQFMGKRGPEVGLQPALYDPEHRFELSGALTDADGRTTWHRLTPGQYFLEVDEPRLWPLRTVIGLDADTGSLTFAVCERCTLEIAARQGGLPRTGLSIELLHVDSKTRMFDYVLDYQLVRSSTGTMDTGADGKLVLEGAPEGNYQWTVLADDGTELRGAFTAVPGTNSIAIDLP